MRPDSSLLLERRVCWMRVSDRACSTTPLLGSGRATVQYRPHRVPRNEHFEALLGCSFG